MSVVQAGRLRRGQQLFGRIAVARRPQHTLDQDVVSPGMGIPQVAGESDGAPVDIPDPRFVQPELRVPAAIGAPGRSAQHEAPFSRLGQVETGNRVAPQHLASVRAVEKDEGGEKRHFGTFVEDQARLHAAIADERT